MLSLHWSCRRGGYARHHALLVKTASDAAIMICSMRGKCQLIMSKRLSPTQQLAPDTSATYT